MIFREKDLPVVFTEFTSARAEDFDRKPVAKLAGRTTSSRGGR